MRLIDADILMADFQKAFPNFDVKSSHAKALLATAPTVKSVSIEDYRSMEQTVYKLTQALAEAEPTKHGRWIVCDDLYMTIDGRVFDGYRECSVCGEMYPYFPEHNYCPNCGARMDGGEE